MKPRVKHAILAALMCALVVFVLPAFADSQARIVRLSFVDGAVQIDRNVGQGFEKAITNLPITQGSKLRTGDNGEAEVEFEDGSTIRLAPEAAISFDQLSLRGNGGKVSLVTMDKGTAYFDVKHKGDDDFRLVVAGRDIQPAKSSHFRAEVNSGELKLAVFNGELEYSDTGEQVKVKKNETLSFALNDPEKYALAKGVDQGQYDWWDKERSDYLTRYAYNKQDRLASPYDASLQYPYGGFWSDLNYYGNFFYVPGYGYAWRPYSVGYGWDPFANGYWVYYPTWGYTWVSPYAWGWAPYRYGGWRFLPSYGWAWLPQRMWAGSWTPVPRVIDPPTSFTPPAPPRNPGSSVVPVGNPAVVPRWNPRTARQDDNMLDRRPGQNVNRPAPVVPGAGGANAKSGAKPSVTPVPESSQPAGRGVPARDRANPGMTHGGAGDVQRPEPRQAPRVIETPRVEHPAPRMSVPVAPPPSFDGGAARPAGTPHPSAPARTPNPK